MAEDDDQQQAHEAQVQDAYRRKIEEMQREAQLKAFLRQATEPAAYERLQNIRLSNPELYQQLIQLILYLRQQGQTKKVTEELLKQLLTKILSQRKESKISFARK